VVGEDVVVSGAGGGGGEPTGSTVNTGCNGEDVGEKALSFVESFPIVMEGDEEVVGIGAGEPWDMGDSCRTSSSSESSLSRNSSASHRRLAAFLVRLAGGEAIVAGEVASGGVGDGWVVAVRGGASGTAGCTVWAAAGAVARLRRRRRRRALAGAQVSGGGAHRRQEIRTS
jgi:hypothetical protein